MQSDIFTIFSHHFNKIAILDNYKCIHSVVALDRFSEAFNLPCGMWNDSKLLISVNVHCYWCHVLLV